MRYKTLLRLTWVLLALTLTIKANSITSDAQQPVEQWAPQQKLVGIFAQQRQLVLVADQNRTVHAFNHQEIEGQKVILYFKWTLAEGWTKPIDIFVLREGGVDIQVMDAVLDQAGIIHLVLEMDGNIYYSRAFAANAGNALAWSTPKLIGEKAKTPFNAAIAGNDKGDLVIIYSGDPDGGGIYAIYSSDAGDTWSDPTPIFFTYNDELVPVSIHLYMGQSGQLHAVWAMVNKAGHGESGFYARLDVENRTWDDPVELETATGLGVLFASVVEYNGGVLAVYYNGDKSNSNWWHWSSDGGENWAEPVRLSPRHVGANGPVSFVIDSNNTLHILFAQRINDENHGLWHSIWGGYGWTTPEAVVSGPLSKDPSKAFDPHSPSAVISQGNVILATWTTDAQIFVEDVWSSYTILDTPELPVVALPTPPPPTATPVTSSATTDLVTPTATPPTRLKAVSEQYNNNKDMTSNPAAPLFLGVAPVILFILIVIARQLYQSNHR